MPIIPANAINSVFYLYSTANDAVDGRDAGGTGFIARYDLFRNGSCHRPLTFYYGITNWHVACQEDEAYPVIRVNTKDGGTDVLKPDEWHFIPGKYDVAVAPLLLDDEKHDVSAISVGSFLDAPPNYRGQAQVGDDVFMIGLFIDHDGKTVNVPSARFGNVSMLPDVRCRIEQPTGYHGVSFVVDMHSRTGFSGSPVYVYRTFGTDLDELWGHDFEEIEIDTSWSNRLYDNGMIRGRGRLKYRNFFRLLGLHWGQFPEEWELREHQRISETDVAGDEKYIKGMSGMTCVIPAWEVREVLDMPEIKKAREKRLSP